MCGNSVRFLGDQRTSENFQLSVPCLFHGIERHGEIAVRTDQQDRLGRLAVDDMQLGKPSHAPRTIYRLVKGLHDSHKILRAAILRLNLWTGQGKGCGCILLAKASSWRSMTARMAMWSSAVSSP